MEARRRPQPEARYKEQIDKTIVKAAIEGKARNTASRNHNHYLRAMVLEGDIQSDCKTAKTPNEITKLIKLGYTKADEIDGIHFYRKRK